MGTESSHQSEDLTCPECGTEFSFSVPADSDVPIPCPECGAATPVSEGTDATDDSEGSTAHGLPGTADDRQPPPGASTSKENTSEEGDDLDPDGTMHGVGPIQDEESDSAEGAAPGLPSPSSPSETTDDDSGADLAPDSTEESADEDSDDDSGAPSLDPGDRWSTPPPQEAVQEADDEKHGAVTEEMDSVPEILADTDADEIEETSEPEPAYDTEPEGTSLVEPEDDEGGAEADESGADGDDDSGTPHGVAPIDSDAKETDADSDEPDANSDEPDAESDGQQTAGASDTRAGVLLDDSDREQEKVVTAPSLADARSDATDADDDEATERDEPSSSERDGKLEERDAADDERADAEEEADEPESTAAPDDRAAAGEKTDRREVDAASDEAAGEAADDPAEAEGEADETSDESTADREPEEVAPDAEDEEAADDSTAEEPVRERDDRDYRVDPSTNLEIAADEAMDRATDEAREERPAGLADPRSVRELRDQIPDDTYSLRVENYVYTDIDRARLAQVIADGKIFAIDGLSREGGPWMKPSDHPALASLRRRSADEAHEMLEAAPESQSREIDLEELEATAEMPREAEPPPIPDESAEAPDSGVDRPRPGSEPEPPSTGDGESRSPLMAIAAVLFVVAASIALYTAYSDDSGEATDKTTSASATSAEEKSTEPPAEESAPSSNEFLTKAISRASSTVAEAVAVDVSDPDLQERVANRLRREGELGPASRIFDVLWRKRNDDPAFARRYLNLLVEAKRWRRARRVAIEGVQNFQSPGSFEETFRETIRKDPALQSYRPLELDDRDDVATLAPSASGDYPAFEIRGPEGERSYLFVPAAAETESWRDQIAAWRLCEIVACKFEVPETRAATISEKRFRELLESEPAEGPTPSLDRLEWTDAEDGRVLRGAVRRWPADAERWPIEAIDLWRPWVSGYVDDVPWDMTVSEAIADRDDLEVDDSIRQRVVRTTGDWTVRRAALQLSNVLTFDYLTNNWGRFEEERDAYGASHHVGSRNFLTLRSETVFQGRGSRRVEGRYNWCFRFSDDMLTSLRLLRRDPVATALYPERSALAEAKIRIFWRQRKRILNRIDFLIGKFSRDEIVAFE